MTFTIDVRGRRKTVSVDRAENTSPSGGRFRVAIHDATGEARRYEVDVQMTDLGVSLIYADDGRSVDVAVTERRRGDYLVQLPRVDLTVSVDDRPVAPDAPREGAAGEQRLTAPMPGRIVRVLVRPGDRVTDRQGLVVIEAMKMENELVASRSGVVTEVVVSEGMSVEAGCLLLLVG